MDYLTNELDSELVIGLVSAVGTENQQVVDLLRERLGRAGYRVETIKVSSDVIPLLVNVPEYGDDKYQRISNLMDAGNKARSLPNAGVSVLANGVASVIFSKRGKEENGSGTPLSKTAFIVDSLKRPEEVAQLRLIYPSGFVLVGVHSEEGRRMQRLVEDLGMTDANAQNLIQRDQDESSVEAGQRVNDTFHLADFFVRISAGRDQLRGDIKRMVELWFGNPFITPTFDEHAMFLAYSAALRSADLSRQVGAVVARNLQILATGANECPQAGGGLYWPTRMPNECIGDAPRGRDYMREAGDSNRAEQLRIIDRILIDAQKPGCDLNVDSLRKLLHTSGIRDLTEYGRVVHAEMEALLSCARNGQATVGTTLYCTTFPCHNCAKHIIAAGVKRVVYVEPYPKSKTLEFHEDSIGTGRPGEGAELVKFVPFVGIGPRRFFDLFSMHLGSTYPLVRKDKETGKKSDWHIENARLRIQMKPVSYLDLEARACALFGENPDPSTSREEP